MKLEGKIVLLVFLLLSFFKGYAQYKKESQPKLVVGIVVDQMRYDYVTRFWEKYGDDGFKKLISDGYFFENTHYSFAPTYTAPGHASIFTGTVPSVHGIIGNNWYDKKSDAMVYCTQDTAARSVGGLGSAGRMSPKNLLTSTLADQMKLASNMKGKSVAVSLKDRGAIIAAGHAGDGAYWFDGETGNWITSTHYMSELPIWVQEFNDENHPEKWLSGDWNTLLPIEEYVESIADNNPFEKPYRSGELPVFPYQLDSLSIELGYGLIRATPFGNTITKDLAKRAVTSEGLGADDIPDFLGISFSSTDYVGHQYGPRAIELEDTYLRLDRDIADLLQFLNSEVGEDNYTLFLTADHGAVETPLYLENYNIPAGYFSIEAFKGKVKSYTKVLFGDENIIKNISNDQIFLDHRLIRKKNLNIDEITSKLISYIITIKGVSKTISAKNLMNGNFSANTLSILQRGFNQKRSGDIIVLLEPGWIIYFRQGTTHGSSYAYDTHVPLIFYGKGVKSGSSFTKVNIMDIAPSLSALLHIQAPNGTTGRVIDEFIKK